MSKIDEEVGMESSETLIQTKQTPKSDPTLTQTTSTKQKPEQTHLDDDLADETMNHTSVGGGVEDENSSSSNGNLVNNYNDVVDEDDQDDEEVVGDENEHEDGEIEVDGRRRVSSSNHHTNNEEENEEENGHDQEDMDADEPDREPLKLGGDNRIGQPSNGIGQVSVNDD